MDYFCTSFSDYTSDYTIKVIPLPFYEKKKYPPRDIISFSISFTQPKIVVRNKYFQQNKQRRRSYIYIHISSYN